MSFLDVSTLNQNNKRIKECCGGLLKLLLVHESIMPDALFIICNKIEKIVVTNLVFWEEMLKINWY